PAEYLRPSLAKAARREPSGSMRLRPLRQSDSARRVVRLDAPARLIFYRRLLELLFHGGGGPPHIRKVPPHVRCFPAASAGDAVERRIVEFAILNGVPADLRFLRRDVLIELLGRLLLFGLMIAHGCLAVVAVFEHNKSLRRLRVALVARVRSSKLRI